ncbi:hypothetical protein JCM18549_13870 [Halolamina salina]
MELRQRALGAVGGAWLRATGAGLGDLPVGPLQADAAAHARDGVEDETYVHTSASAGRGKTAADAATDHQS